MNFTTMLEWSARRHRDRTAVIAGDVTLTYGEVAARATRLASGLRELGVRKGDPVILCTGNRFEHFEAEFAVAKLGAAKVPLLTTSTATEMGKYLNAVEPAAIICSAASAEAIRQARADYQREIAVLNLDEPGEGEVRHEEVVQGSSEAPVVEDIGAADLYAVRFTGGTTGMPKGVMADHRGMVNLTNTFLLNHPIERDNVFLSIHPLTHACGYMACGYWVRGATNVILPEFGFSPELFVERVLAHDVDHTFFIPTVLNVLLDSPLVRETDLSQIRFILYGGAPISSSRLLQALDKFGPVFCQIYGSTESPMFTVTLLPEDHEFDGTEPPERLKSAGRVALNCEVRVVGDDGADMPPGEPGEIVARGDNTMVSYWRNPELTAARKVDGWVHTGDLGYFDEEGYLYLVDRKEDMIISGGFNVWPAEVEDVIYSHPAVHEAAVFGVKDGYWGERVTAAVVLNAGAQATPEELIAYLKARLVNYKVPKAVIIRDEPLPKSGVGKLLRRIVREQEAAREAAVSG